MIQKKERKVRTMTLEEGKELLEREGIPHELWEYGSEKEYWESISLYPHIANAQNCPVTVLRITAPNGKAHLELQFNEGQFAELWFGGYSFELFDTRGECLERELLECICHVRSGRCWCEVDWDLDRKRWCGDHMSDLEEDPGLETVLERLARPKDFWERLFRKRFLHEVYDWNEYHRIER